MLPKAPNFRIDGQRALVTGASRGVGLAAAVALAQAGAIVTLVSRSDSELKSVCAEIQADGGQCDYLVLDVTDSQAVNEKIAVREPFQILVNNAGMNRPKPLVELEDDDIDAVLNLNVKAAFYVTRVVAKGLLTAGLPGSVINISSQMGLVGSSGRTIYCASKHAIEGMSKALAWELGHANIRVCLKTPHFENGSPAELHLAALVR
jgi:NAD(P)-dependent dehydrogenase (short-subunit alcohol dehydrogenase family)